MGDDLETLCGRFSLIGGETVCTKILEGDIAADREKGEKCLVGRIGDTIKVNKDAFKSILSHLWYTVGFVVFSKVQDNVCLFELVDVEDEKRVMEGRPGSLDWQILVLNVFDKRVPPDVVIS
jgi:hypothetical protein